MFVAQHISGERFVSFESEEKTLRQLARQNEFFCPRCNDNVLFRSGTKKPHFYHKRLCSNPDPYSEPESQTHLEGKYRIYSWLKHIFPRSQVELEYGVPETNQRSDIMLILPSGDRIAFEFQCSSIAGYRWLERHQLYQEAGILDVWILNNDFLNDSSKFTGLERAIYDKKKFVQYLNTASNSIAHVFLGHRYNSFIHDPTIIHGDLLSSELRGSIVWSSELQNYFIRLEKQKRLEEEELVREAEFKKRQKEDAKIQVEKARRFRYQETQIIRKNLEKGMNEKEVTLFQKLFKKYAYTNENFPGLFMVNVNYSDLIKTPPQLWQLWIFDQIRAAIRTNYKKDKNPKIWLKNIVDDFKQLRSSGVFRIQKNESNSANYTFALYSYFNILNAAGILLNLGIHTTKYQKILTNDIPLFPNHKDNILIQMHFEDYTHEAINKVEKQFIQNIRQSQDIFNKRMSKQIKVPQQSALTLNADKIKDYITIIESYSLKDTPKQILFERISSNQIIERYRKNSKLNVEDFNKLKTLIEALRSYQ